MFEMTNLGIKYMAIRFVGNIMGVIIIALLLSKTTSVDDRNKIIGNVNNL